MNLIKHISKLLFFLIVSLNMGYAQLKYSRYDSIPVIISDDTLLYPWAGGFNNPQLSPIDLNGDNVLDLFIFDRTGNKIMTFLNKGIADSVSYSYAPGYETKFPSLSNWVLLADYNCDGKNDIFTSAVNGVAVYRNDFNITSGLIFTKVSDLLYSKDPKVMQPSDPISIYVSTADMPAITDVDNDGDLDILVFAIAGNFIEFHKNNSIELFGSCDRLDSAYILTDICWGKFEENGINNSVTLGISCKTGTATQNQNSVIEQRHSGSTLTAIDIDGDIDKDILIGDISFNNLVHLVNGGTKDAAQMISTDLNFPSYDTSVNITLFPVAFYFDVNNDSLSDLLVAPNAANISDNFNSIWYYKNTGTKTSPKFQLQMKNFLQNDMIETGSGANPAFFDYNADSLLDLVIGNYGYYSSSGLFTSGLSLYENIGTLTAPVYKLTTRNYANINPLGLYGVYPSFGDMDADGDQDMMLGESEGLLYYFTNTAGAGDTANFVLSQSNYKGIDVGQYSTPQIVDVNKDGDLDLLIGERSGDLSYYENNGTPAVPDFSALPSKTPFGGIDVLIPCCTGYSSPFLVDLNNDGTRWIVAGSEQGYLYLYKDTYNNIDSNFALQDSLYIGGSRKNISLAEINNDGKPEIAVGDYCGGITILKYDTLVGISEKEEHKILNNEKIILFPVPANDHLTFIFSSEIISHVAFVELYDIIGKVVLHDKFLCNIDKTIDISSLQTGTYIIKFSFNDKIVYKKFVVGGL